MESNQCKKINVSEHFFSYGKSGSNHSAKREKTKKKRSVDNISDINTKNVKELLLQKLKQYKKEQTRKKKIVPETPIDVKIIKKKPSIVSTPYAIAVETPLSMMSASPSVIPTVSSMPPDPLYGNLKNGKKPTLKQLINRSRSSHHQKPKKNNEKITVEVEKKYTLGRNKTMKKVGVFIKNDVLRRKIDDDKRNLRNVKLKTVKNYLKTQNLIKYGSYAPNELLREIYDSSKLCGNVNNINGSNLVHNFMSSDP